MSSDYLHTDTPAEYIAIKLRSHIIDKIVGEPTIETYNILFEQLAVGASLVKSTQWGGKHGHLALITGDARYQLITNDDTLNTDEVAEFGAVDPAITADTAEFTAKRLSREWDIKIRGRVMQEEMKEHLLSLIVGAVDEPYIIERKKDYVGYSNETPKSILHHIKKNWCKITTLQKGKALALMREPWDYIIPLSAYETQLDKAMLRCEEMGVPQVDSDKIQTYVQSMYGSGIFEEKEMVVWENRLANIKSWEQCKLYFGTLYK